MSSSTSSEGAAAPSVSVRLPTPLRRFAGGAERVIVQGATARAALDSLEAAHPGIKALLCEADGRLRRFVRVFANGEDLRAREGLETALQEGDEVTLAPALGAAR